MFTHLSFRRPEEYQTGESERFWRVRPHSRFRGEAALRNEKSWRNYVSTPKKELASGYEASPGGYCENGLEVEVRSDLQTAFEFDHAGDLTSRARIDRGIRRAQVGPVEGVKRIELEF